MKIDYQLFNVLHSLANKHWLADGLFIFLAEYLGYLLIAILLFLIFYNYRRWRDRLYYLLLSAFSILVARGILVAAIHFFYYRPRPFKALDFTPLVDHITNSSLPSGHATVFFAVAVLVYLINRKYFWYFLTGAILISIARVVVGVHWPTDVLVGGILGIISVIVARWLLPKKV